MKKRNGKKTKLKDLLRKLKQTAYLATAGTALYFLVIGVNYWIHNSGIFQLSQIEVSGTRFMSPEELSALIPVEPDGTILDLDIESIKRKLEEQPFVRTASIGRKFPGILKLNIDERVPVAMIVLRKIFFIDEEGYLLPKRLRGSNSADFPIISGIQLPQQKPGTLITDERISKVISFINLVQTYYPGISAHISEILYRGGGNLSLILSGSLTRVNCGSEDYRFKLAKLEYFLKYCEEQRITERLRTINLNYENQIIIKEAD